MPVLRETVIRERTTSIVPCRPGLLRFFKSRRPGRPPRRSDKELCLRFRGEFLETDLQSAVHITRLSLTVLQVAGAVIGKLGILAMSKIELKT